MGAALIEQEGWKPQAQHLGTGQHTKVKHAISLHQRGLITDAERICEAIVREEPNHFTAIHLLGIIALQTQRSERSVELITKAIKVRPEAAAAHNNLGSAFSSLKHHEQALASYDRAIAAKPDYAEAYYNRGNVLSELKSYEKALESYSQAIALQRDLANAYYNRGNTLSKLKRFEDALADFDEAIALKPDLAEAYSSRGNALNDLKRHADALLSHDRAISVEPGYAEAHNSRGITLADLKRYQEAIASYDKALLLKWELAEALYNRGNALNNLKCYEEAVADYDKATALKPDFAEAYYNRGNALNSLRRYQEAVENYDTAILLKQDFFEAYSNRGNVLNELMLHEKAILSHDEAVRLRPDSPEALNNRGTGLSRLKRFEDALKVFDRVIAMKPDFVDAYRNRGAALIQLKCFDEALASYDRAMSLNRASHFTYGIWLHTKMMICDWSEMDKHLCQLIDRIERAERVSPPFPILSLSNSLELQQQTAKMWALAKYPLTDTGTKPRSGSNQEKIRIGYFSADFYDHATAHLMAGVFENHDRSKFEIFGFSFGADETSGMGKRLHNAFDKFINGSNLSDGNLATLARTLQIDIAIDLKGFTTDSRTGIFATRAAPIQVNYLGYPGTMGADYVDYLIADTTVIPVSDQRYYSEKIVYLPNSYQANDCKREISHKIFTRDEAGLPETGFVFCCFNNNYKITPSVFDCWMRILKQIEGSVLWLFESNASAAANLRKEATARGVYSERLVFAKRMSLPEHLARHRLANVFLDTLPYNAHTTASDSLWAGLPVLTQIGETFAGRVAASLLKAIDLPEMIVATEEAYEALAIELARKPEKLAAVNAKLANNRITRPLFDTKLFTTHLESAYTEMYERHGAGLPPDNIYLAN